MTCVSTLKTLLPPSLRNTQVLVPAPVTASTIAAAPQVELQVMPSAPPSTGASSTVTIDEGGWNLANPGYKPAKRMSMVIGIPVDTTGDGVADSMGYDTTGDGQVDCQAYSASASACIVAPRHWPRLRDFETLKTPPTTNHRPVFFPHHQIDAVDRTGDGKINYTLGSSSAVVGTDMN